MSESGANVWEFLTPLLLRGSALEMKVVLDAKLPAPSLRSHSQRSLLRAAATRAAIAGNMAMVRYLCEEEGVPVNFVPPEEIEGSYPEFGDVTPLMMALQNDHEDIALYLLSLGDEDPQSLHL